MKFTPRNTATFGTSWLAEDERPAPRLAPVATIPAGWLPEADDPSEIRLSRRSRDELVAGKTWEMIPEIDHLGYVYPDGSWIGVTEDDNDLYDAYYAFLGDGTLITSNHLSEVEAFLFETE